MAQQQVQVIESVKFRDAMVKSAPKFEAMLKGSGIPVEKFNQIATTAVLGTPSIMKCNLNTVMLAIMDAAQDGLSPDGVEGAIVPYRDKELGWRAVWIPMIYGLRKKIMQSGEVVGFICEVVHVGDDFYYQLGDQPQINHMRRTDGSRRNEITHVYSVADSRNGYKSRHVMTIKEVLEIRDHYSKAQHGPWQDEMAFPEMVKKTCARAHAKMLPMSADAERAFRRFDAIQGVSEPDAGVDQRKLMEASTLMLDTFAAPPEITDERPETDTSPKGKPKGAQSAPKSIDEMATQYVAQALAFITKVEDSASLNDWADAERGARANLNENQKKIIVDAFNKRMTELQDADGKEDQS